MSHHFGFVRNCIIAGALALTATVAPALAAGETYLDFESTGSSSELPVKGEVKSSDMKSTMVRVMSFSWGAGKDGAIPGAAIGSATGGAGAGKIRATPESLDVVLGDEATSKLFGIAATGRPVAHVRLLVYKDAPDGGKVPLYSALMSNVFIVSLDWKGTKSDQPTAHVTLDYTTLQIQENTKGASGSPSDAQTPISWDQITNKSVITVP